MVLLTSSSSSSSAISKLDFYQVFVQDAIVMDNCGVIICLTSVFRLVGISESDTLINKDNVEI